MPFHEKISLHMSSFLSPHRLPTLSLCLKWLAVISTSAQSFRPLPHVKPCKKLHEVVNVLLVKTPETTFNMFFIE